MTTRILTVAFLVALTSCMTSPSALVVARADPQRGAVVDVYMSDDRRHTGELLALDDSTVAMLTQERIAIGSLSHVRAIVLDTFNTIDVGAEGRISRGSLRKGRQASRFPYGITAPAMARLLETARQAVPDRLEETKP